MTGGRNGPRPGDEPDQPVPARSTWAADDAHPARNDSPARPGRTAHPASIALQHRIRRSRCGRRTCHRVIDRCRRPDPSPSPSTISSAVSTIFAPSLRRACPPRFRPLSTLPGTAITSRPCSSAHARGDQRSRLLRRLDHDDGQRESADQTIPHRKVVRQRRGAGRIFADDEAGLSDLRGERLVLRRIDVVHARAEHRDGSTGRERAAMCSGIDAARQPAHDGHATRGQVGGQPRRGVQRDRRCRARSDDGNRRSLQSREIAAIPQHRRTIGDGREQRRKRRIAPWQRVDPRLLGATRTSRASSRRGAARSSSSGSSRQQTGCQTEFGQLVVEQGQSHRVIKGHRQLRPPAHRATAGVRRRRHTGRSRRRAASGSPEARQAGRTWTDRHLVHPA